MVTPLSAELLTTKSPQAINLIATLTKLGARSLSNVRHEIPWKWPAETVMSHHHHHLVFGWWLAILSRLILSRPNTCYSSSCSNLRGRASRPADQLREGRDPGRMNSSPGTSNSIPLIYSMEAVENFRVNRVVVGVMAINSTSSHIKAWCEGGMYRP